MPPSAIGAIGQGVQQFELHLWRCFEVFAAQREQRPVLKNGASRGPTL